MKTIYLASLFFTVSLSALADSGTFGNPYPKKYPNMVQGNGVIYLLPKPLTMEKPRVVPTPFYIYPEYPPVRIKDDYYYYNNESIIENTRNVLNGARGPSHRVPTSNYPGGRNITTRTPIYHRSF